MKLNIKYRRECLNLTQKDIAEALGLHSASTIAMWESGARLPRADKLPQLAAALGCTVDDLYDEQSA